MGLDVLMASLLDAIRRLAQDPAAQERWLREDGTWPSLDELVLTFDDVQGAAAALVAYGDVGPDAVAEIGLVAEHIHEMSQHGGAWEPQALRSDPAWEELCRLAARALESLNAVRV